MCSHRSAPEQKKKKAISYRLCDLNRSAQGGYADYQSAVGRGRGAGLDGGFFIDFQQQHQRVLQQVCMCVCVCERERERDRETERQRDRERDAISSAL